MTPGFALALLLAAKAQAPLAPRSTRLARVAVLEDRRSLGEGSVTLAALLADPDRSVRRRAALAAGRIGEHEITGALAKLLGDPDTEVRRTAAFALGLVADPAAAPALRTALGATGQDALVRGRAAEALGRLGDAGDAAAIAAALVASTGSRPLPIVVRGGADDDGSPADAEWGAAQLMLYALARLKDGPAAATALIDVASGAQRFDWWAAAWTAMRIEKPEMAPVLRAALGSSDPLCRVFAARGLGALKDPADVPRLAELTRGADANVAVAALRGLGLSGAAAAVAPAVRALESENPVVKYEALRAIAALPGDKSVQGAVFPYLANADPWIRSAAFPALARTDGEAFSLVLSGLDPEPVFWVRAQIAAALGIASDRASSEILDRMLRDEEPRVIPAVLEALRTARGEGALPALLSRLADPDFAVRAAAADGLAELKAQGQTEALGAAYKASLQDADPDARFALIKALAAQDDAAALAAIKDIARTDPLRVVRARALAALHARGDDEPIDLGPENVTRPFLDYRQALGIYEQRSDAPLFTPRAYVRTRRGTIEIRLDVVDAPLTSASFMALARRGFYDGLTLHRVVPGFVIQGGCPRGDGNGSPGAGTMLRCELSPRAYRRGSVGMALSGKDTGGSQFFITHVPTPHLDGAYALFGFVAQGMDVVDRIEPGDVIERIDIVDGR